MDNIYKTPESSLVDSSTEASQAIDYRLFKVSAIGLATFLGSILAGGIIMAMNFQRQGKGDAAKQTFFLSLLATVVFIGAALAIPADMGQGLNLVFVVIQVAIMTSIGRSQQEASINWHTANGGEMESNWKAAGIAILISLAIFAAMFVVISLFIV